jgi:hypothetical protein
MKSAAFLVSIFLIHALCFPLSWEVRAEDGKKKGQKEPTADYALLAGTWMRPDGGYLFGARGRTLRWVAASQVLQP